MRLRPIPLILGFLLGGLVMGFLALPSSSSRDTSPPFSNVVTVEVLENRLLVVTNETTGNRIYVQLTTRQRRYLVEQLSMEHL